jgi:prepilin-type N-terminal cleavage/methylation domain-containing protein
MTMRTPSSSLAAREGFTLVEVLIAMTVLVIGVLGTLALIDRANATTVTTRSREAAVNVARELVEAARSVPFAKLTPASLETEIAAQPGLADDGQPAGWTIRRRGFTYTVTASVCTFDDARDGGGTHTAGGFCADSAAPSPTPDRNPEDYRRVRVEVRWTDRGRDRVVHQTVLVNNPGSAGAPAVRTLVIDTGTGTAIAPVTNHVYATPANNMMPFDLTTSSTPATLHWLLDGTSQAPITTGGGLAWTFDWPVGQAGDPDSLVDGTYVVSAEAFDTYGVSGPSRSLTVTLNRLPPSKVEGLVGGRTGDPSTPADQVVDLEWLPNPERDIIGYSVQRIDAAGNVVEVCAREDRTACFDADPPVEDGLVYRVFAWDRNHVDGQPRASVQSDPLVVNMGNNPPAPPVSPQAQLQADGSVQLSWTRPSPEDPDAGDSIAFFRIYRDGLGRDSRYAIWNGTDFNDGNTANTAHEYWITSVDTRYGESAPVKAVAP